MNSTQEKTPSVRYRLGIALLGKGSTNHLHRKEVVDAFRQSGVDVKFWVREDYISLVKKLPGCEYHKCVFRPEEGWRAKICNILEQVRGFYPARDIGKSVAFKVLCKEQYSFRQRWVFRLMRIAASFRWVLALLVRVESRFRQPDCVEGVDPQSVDQLLLLGIGTINSELEGLLTLWGRRQHIPIVHIVGNYDNLSSKGFRGVDVERLLVWGPSMYDDAVSLHGIAPSRITMIGSLRYNAIPLMSDRERDDFVRSIGFDPLKPIIMFAGFTMEFHYFEMLDIVESFAKQNQPLQLILRVYPNKTMMSSVYMQPLLAYARSLPGVYVSLADPHAQIGMHDKEVVQIEENDLWNSLRCCDVLVNQFSTISLEGCIFDKPVINMWYFPPDTRMVVRGPVYISHAIHLYHIRRILSYGAIKTAHSRNKLVAQIRHALANPGELAEERRAVVRDECGLLDGAACERLVKGCIDEYLKTKNSCCSC